MEFKDNEIKMVYNQLCWVTVHALFDSSPISSHLTKCDRYCLFNCYWYLKDILDEVKELNNYSEEQINEALESIKLDSILAEKKQIFKSKYLEVIYYRLVNYENEFDRIINSTKNKAKRKDSWTKRAYIMRMRCTMEVINNYDEEHYEKMVKESDEETEKLIWWFKNNII